MTFPLPGLGYILVTISFYILAYRLWQTFQRTKGKIAQYFFYQAVLVGTATFLNALCEIFFVNNSSMLKILLIPLQLSVQLGTAFHARLIFYLKFPQIPDKFGFFTYFILGMVGVILYIIFPVNPSIGPHGLIIWNSHPLPEILSYTLISITGFTLGVILISESLRLRPSREWINGFGLGIICFLGLLAGFFAYIFETEPLRTFAMINLAIGVFLLTLLTQKPPSPRYVREI